MNKTLGIVFPYILFCCLCACPAIAKTAIQDSLRLQNEEKAFGYFGEDQIDEFRTLDQLRAAMFLNESLNTLTRIINSNSKMVLLEEQNRLDNIWEWKGATDFTSVLNFRKNLQSDLNELVKNEINKERYQEAFEKRKNAAARDAFLNAISGVQVNINPISIATNILITSARSYMDYSKRKEELATELDEQLWNLEQQEMDVLTDLRRDVQDIYIETFSDYDLDNRMGLKLAEVERFYQIIDIDDCRLKTQELIDGQKVYQYFAPYWYERGKSYIELYETIGNDANLKEALSSFDRYMDMSNKCQLYRYDPRIGMISLYSLLYRRDLSRSQKESYLKSIVNNIKTDGSARIFAALYYINEIGNVNEGFNILRSNLNPDVTGHNETILAAASLWDKLKDEDIKNLICQKVLVSENVDLDTYVAFMLRIKKEQPDTFYQLCRQLQKSLFLDPVRFKRDGIEGLVFNSRTSTLNIDIKKINLYLEERPISQDNESLLTYHLSLTQDKRFFKDRSQLIKVIKRIKYFRKHPNEIDDIQLISKTIVNNEEYYYLSASQDWRTISPFLNHRGDDRKKTKSYNLTEKIETSYRRFYAKYSVEEIPYEYSIGEISNTNLKDWGFEPTYTFKAILPHDTENGELKEKYSVSLCFVTDRIKKNDTYLRLCGLIFNNEYIQF